MNKSLFLAAAVAATALAGCNKGSDDVGPVGNGPVANVAAPNGGDWSAVVAATPEGGFVMGNPSAPVKVVEFGSLTCPHCREFDEEGVKPLIDTYVKSGRVSYEFRNFVRDPFDMAASLIARCNGPASFFGLTRQIYADQPNWMQKLQAVPPAQMQAISALPANQQLPKMAELAGFPQFAALRGVPIAKSQACLTNQAEADRLVQMNSDATAAYNIPGTPSFLLNGKMVSIEGGATPWKQLEAKLKKALGG